MAKTTGELLGTIKGLSKTYNKLACHTPNPLKGASLLEALAHFRGLGVS